MSDKILIVDDSRVQLMMMKKLLKDVFAEYEVKAYPSPAEALKGIMAEEMTFHFALIDYNMEGMTGIELIDTLLKLEFKPIQTNNTSLLSANIQEAVQEKAFSLGIDFIAKPFDKEKLINFLNKKGISYE